MEVNRKSKFNSIVEARGFLEVLMNSNKVLLKKNPHLNENYSFLIAKDSVSLEYSIEDKSKIIVS